MASGAAVKCADSKVGIRLAALALVLVTNVKPTATCASRARVVSHGSTHRQAALTEISAAHVGRAGTTYGLIWSAASMPTAKPYAAVGYMRPAYQVHCPSYGDNWSPDNSHRVCARPMPHMGRGAVTSGVARLTSPVLFEPVLPITKHWSPNTDPPCTNKSAGHRYCLRFRVRCGGVWRYLLWCAR